MFYPTGRKSHLKFPAMEKVRENSKISNNSKHAKVKKILLLL
jgi:hypothetical protein